MLSGVDAPTTPEVIGTINHPTAFPHARRRSLSPAHRRSLHIDCCGGQPVGGHPDAGGRLGINVPAVGHRLVTRQATEAADMRVVVSRANLLMDDGGTGIA